MNFLKQNWFGIVVLVVMVVFFTPKATVTEVVTNGLGGTTNLDSLTLSGTLTTATISASGNATVSGNATISGTVTALEASEEITADDTVTASQSGTVFYISGAEATSTLPAVATATGTVYTYVVAASLTGDFHIDSAEGDNIEGSAIVAGAVVDCDAEDQLNFVSDGENLGDFVQLRSNGQKWFLTQSNVLTTAKLTCTDPT